MQRVAVISLHTSPLVQPGSGDSGGMNVYVREVASQKTAALRMSLDAVERQAMPFVGETGGIGSGDVVEARPVDRAPDRAGMPQDPGLQDRLAAARRDADAHRDHGERRAPRPDKMQR